MKIILSIEYPYCVVVCVRNEVDNGYWASFGCCNSRSAAAAVISPLGFKILFISQVSQIGYKANPSAYSLLSIYDSFGLSCFAMNFIRLTNLEAKPHSLSYHESILTTLFLFPKTIVTQSIYNRRMRIAHDIR